VSAFAENGENGAAKPHVTVLIVPKRYPIDLRFGDIRHLSHAIMRWSDT